MKDKVSIQLRCQDCYFVRRTRLFVYCRKHPRHKARQA